MSKKPSRLDKLANWLGYTKGVALSTSAVFSQKEYASAKSSDQLAAFASWVFACVKARSRDVARIEIKMYKVTNRATGEVEEILEHDALSLLRTVNPFMTFMQLIEYTQAYKDLMGECFWYLERAGSNGKGIITQIWLLRPDYIDIKTSPDGFIAGYTYKVPGNKPMDFDVQEIIHHKEFNPKNPYRGMGVVMAAATVIDTDEYADEFNKNFFKNSATPDIVLSTEQKLTDAQLKRMHSEWQNKYGGTRNAHRMAILEGGLDVKPFSMSQRDIEFLEGKGFNRDKILAMFEVPKSRLGMTEGVSVSNAEATINIYLKYLVKPLMEGLRDALNEFYLPLYKGTEDMFFDIEDPVPEDVGSEMDRLKAEFAMGAITPNEVREEGGRDQVDGLDSFYLAINQQAIAGDGADAAQAAADAQAVTDQNGKPVTGKAQRRKKHVSIPAMRLKERVGKRIADEVRDEVMKSIIGSMPAFVSKAEKAQELPQSSWKQETKDAFWKQLVGKTDKYENVYKDRLIEFFDQQEKAVLTRFDSTQKSIQKISQSDIESILISVSAENKIAVDLLLPIVKQILEESGNDTLDFLTDEPVAFNAQSEAVKQFLRTDALKGIRVMNKTTKSKLRKALSDALENGVGPVETARGIRDIFTEAKSVRALRVARTESLKAANRGALEAYQQSGVVAGKEWYTAEDEQVCQWCGPLDHKVVSIDQNFFHEGESYMGDKGGTISFNLESIPTPPLHPNCRCTIVPITVSQRAPKPDAVEEKATPEDVDTDRLEREVIAKLLPKFESKIDEKVAEVKKEVEQNIADSLGEILESHE